MTRIRIRLLVFLSMVHIFSRKLPLLDPDFALLKNNLVPFLLPQSLVTPLTNDQVTVLLQQMLV